MLRELAGVVMYGVVVAIAVVAILIVRMAKWVFIPKK